MFVLTSMLSLAASAQTDNPDPCDHFFLALTAVPNQTLIRARGSHESVWDGKRYGGCEVRLVTNNTLLSGKEVPAFHATADTALYRKGWRENHAFVADGPGSSVVGLENGPVLCLVSHDQPAYVEDKTGEIIQSETLTITVQCRRK